MKAEVRCFCTPRLLRCDVARALAGSLSTFATDATGQLDVLGHDSHTLGVDSAQVGVLEQSNQVGLAGFLRSDERKDERSSDERKTLHMNVSQYNEKRPATRTIEHRL
jgi:hypothetical protein